MPIPVKSLIISWRSIGLSLLLSVVVGLAAVSEPLDRIIEAAIGRVAWRPVSGDIVVVSLDDRTLDEVADRNFSMTQHAQLVRAIDKAGAKRLFIDFTYDRRERDPDFPVLTKAVKQMGDRAILAVAAKSARSGDSELAHFPSPAFGTAARIACIGWEYELWQVWRIPITLDVNGRTIPSFSSLLANRRSDKAGVYALDYSYRTSSITDYSASDVLSGKVSRELAGRDVIFAPTAAEFQDSHYLPGHDRVP
ncbi:CHASE2 domain-containing protein, partial [Sphingopyxis sp.]|uniref:CHASE2 domain-containing protein n=1 Tax=Sphingopyxis sp. TaxID=1908224 RepID=UPI002ED9E1BE